MLNLQAQLKFSKYPGLYDDIVPKNNLLRKIKENIDFSFINPLMRISYCEYYGRPAYEPEMMFKILFLKILYNISDRDVINRAQTDMSFKFFLNLDPEDEVPNASLLTKFRKTRISEDMLDEFLRETVNQAVSKNLIKSDAIIIDSTHSRSKHSPKTPTQILRDMTKALRKEIYKTQYELSEKFPEKPNMEDSILDEIEYTKQLVEVVKDKLQSSKAKKLLNSVIDTLELPNLKELQNYHDSDAKIGHKNADDSFFGYKNNIAITEDEQIITGLTITNGNEADSGEFNKLIVKSIENGIDIKEALGDTAYSWGDNLEFAKSKGIKVISKLHPNIGAVEFKDEHVHFNKDAGTYECKNGCLAKVGKTRKDKKNTERVDYSFRTADCKKCPYFNNCVGGKSTKYRRISRTTTRAIYDEQKVFQETEYFKSRYKRRNIIEGKNADLKNNYGLGRMHGTGLFSMKVQSFFTAVTANIVKITRLVEAM